jgi:hypothetical protein
VPGRARATDEYLAQPGEERIARAIARPSGIEHVDRVAGHADHRRSLSFGVVYRDSPFGLRHAAGASELAQPPQLET